MASNQQIDAAAHTEAQGWETAVQTRNIRSDIRAQSDAGPRSDYTRSAAFQPMAPMRPAGTDGEENVRPRRGPADSARRSSEIMPWRIVSRGRVFSPRGAGFQLGNGGA